MMYLPRNYFCSSYRVERQKLLMDAAERRIQKWQNRRVLVMASILPCQLRRAEPGACLRAVSSGGRWIVQAVLPDAVFNFHMAARSGSAETQTCSSLHSNALVFSLVDPSRFGVSAKMRRVCGCSVYNVGLLCVCTFHEQLCPV
jgi:hypothetical protein